MAEGNGNGHANGNGERRLLSYLPAAAAWTAIVASYAVQSNKIDILRGDTDRHSTEMATLRATSIENVSRIAAVNDRYTAQANRIGQHDLQFADLNRAQGELARLIATLTERLAGYATADNPRMREVEADVATLKGRTEEMGRSLEALRAYVVESGRRAGVAPGPSGR